MSDDIWDELIDIGWKAAEWLPAAVALAALVVGIAVVAWA